MSTTVFEYFSDTMPAVPTLSMALAEAIDVEAITANDMTANVVVFITFLLFASKLNASMNIIGEAYAYDKSVVRRRRKKGDRSRPILISIEGRNLGLVDEDKS